MKLRIKSLSAYNSDRLIGVLKQVLKFSDEEFNQEANIRTIEDFVWNSTEKDKHEWAMKDISLLFYGTDLMVDTLRKLWIVGDGDCPNCGSNEWIEDYEENGAHCTTCGKHFAPTIHTIIIDGMSYKN